MIVKSKPQKNSKQQYSSKQHGHPRALLKQAKQSIGLSTVVPFVPFGCSSRSCRPPIHRHFTRSLPAFGRAIASTIPLHSVTLRKLRSTVFQPYHACRPPLFSGCSFRTAIGVGTAPITLYDQFTFILIMRIKG